jgi:UDP-GlcNAc:undecaprenyl-phosphate GlcNAc-1-phosphate transferase
MRVPIIPFVAFLIAAFVTAFLTGPVKRLAIRFGAVAIPRKRDVHSTPVPRWGGIAMYAGFVVTLALVYVWIYFDRTHFPWRWPQLMQFLGVILGATVVAISGVLDDKFELSAIWQTLALIFAGIVLIQFGVRIDGVTNPFAHVGPVFHRNVYDPRTWLPFSRFWADFCTLLWVFGVAKTVDFMDGLDGLAAGISAISAATMALMAAQAGQYEVSVIAATLVGVCLGFLRYNYNPASIIMGTVGAQFIGFILASLAIIGTFKMAAAVSVALPILVLGVPIFDGVRVLVHRTLHGEPVTQADRSSHIHHILINRGLSHRQAVWVIYGIAALFCAIALILFHFTVGR